MDGPFNSETAAGLVQFPAQRLQAPHDYKQRLSNKTALA